MRPFLRLACFRRHGASEVGQNLGYRQDPSQWCCLTLRCTRSATAGFASLRSRVISNVRRLCMRGMGRSLRSTGICASSFTSSPVVRLRVATCGTRKRAHPPFFKPSSLPAARSASLFGLSLRPLDKSCHTSNRPGAVPSTATLCASAFNSFGRHCAQCRRTLRCTRPATACFARFRRWVNSNARQHGTHHGLRFT